MADEIEVSLIIKALAEGFDKLGEDIGGLGEAAKKAKDPIEKTGLSLTDLKSGIDLAKEAANAFAGVMQQAFEMGKEWATITATADSLTHLAGEAGYAGDLIADLEKAAGGTVDDLDYMGSTIRLLTGETGDFANRLASAAPELLTMARAAVKLNPTLGDTATAYEAITKAIETGQVRALKDYGIVIEATGTKEERLQEILDKMPGLMEQVGGSVETATDKYSRFEMALDNVKDALGQTIDEMLNLESATNATQSFADYLDLSNEIEAAFEAGNITLKQRNELVWRHDYLMQNSTETMTQLNTAINENKGALDYAALAIQNVEDATTGADGATLTWAENLFYAEQATTDLDDSTYKAYTTSAIFADRLALVNEKAALMTERLQNADAPLDEFMDSLSQDIQSPLESFIEDLQFFSASGGQDFATAFEQIKQALANNEITAGEAQAFTAELLAQIQNVKIAMGDLTFDEAAESLAGTLNISLEEAAKLLKSVGNEVRYLEGDHNVHFNISQSGNMPAVPGSGGAPVGPGQGGTAFATGADFIVPPGYPNDSFPMFVQSGEHVKVTPAGEGGQSANGGGAQMIQIVLDGRVLAEVMNPYLGNQARLAQANGAGRYGR